MQRGREIEKIEDLPATVYELELGFIQSEQVDMGFM